MISQASIFLRNRLNSYLTEKAGSRSDGSQEDKVIFPSGEKMDPISFKLGAVTALLINLEEENTLRAADPYSRVNSQGVTQKIQPEIRLNFYLLFVARFKLYEQSLSFLSLIVNYFQNHRYFNRVNAPELDAGLEKLLVEMITLPFAEQNEVWNALRTTYHPSVLYKVKLVVFSDNGKAPTPSIEDQSIDIGHETHEV